MKVDDNLSTSGAAPSSDLRSRAVGGAPQTGAGRAPGTSRADGAADSAGLSSLSVQLSRALQQEPPETVARIGQLQEAVARGTYAIPSGLVSASIVAATLAEP